MDVLQFKMTFIRGISMDFVYEIFTNDKEL